MKIRTVGIATSVLAFIGLVAVGCSSSTDSAASAAASGNCPAVGSKACAMDSPVDQKGFDSCEKLKGDAKCGTKFVDYLKCAGANVSCGADGKADSAKITTACKSQFDAYGTCVSAAPAGDGG